MCLAGFSVFLLASGGRCDVSIGDIVRWGLVRKPLSPIECPVFNIPLDGWSEFELKASTNNFTNLVYYIKSSGTNAFVDDTNVWVYFTDDFSADVRQWHRSAPATAIGSQLVNPTNSEVEFVIVCPSHQCVEDWQAWMCRTNNALVWSFVRYDGIGLEMNASGTKTHWNPVIPVEWRKERIAP